MTTIYGDGSKKGLNIATDTLSKVCLVPVGWEATLCTEDQTAPLNQRYSDIVTL